MHWSRVDDVLKQAGALTGKVVDDPAGKKVAARLAYEGKGGPELAYRFVRPAR